MTVDFRQIYASVLEQWFGAKPEVIRQILFQDFATVPIIKAGSSTGVSRWDGVVDGLTLYHVTPNPVRDAAAVRYRVDTETVVRVDVFDPLGFHVATLANGQHTPGEYSAPFSTTTLPSGTYHVRCSAGRRQATTPVVVVR
jgi:hypothetical protein